MSVEIFGTGPCQRTRLQLPGSLPRASCTAAGSARARPGYGPQGAVHPRPAGRELRVLGRRSPALQEDRGRGRGRGRGRTRTAGARTPAAPAPPGVWSAEKTRQTSRAPALLGGPRRRAPPHLEELSARAGTGVSGARGCGSRQGRARPHPEAGGACTARPWRQGALRGRQVRCVLQPCLVPPRLALIQASCARVVAGSAPKPRNLTWLWPGRP